MTKSPRLMSSSIESATLHQSEIPSEETINSQTPSISDKTRIIRILSKASVHNGPSSIFRNSRDGKKHDSVESAGKMRSHARRSRLVIRSFSKTMERFDYNEDSIVDKNNIKSVMPWKSPVCITIKTFKHDGL